jgi:formylglycine-generating enzyme required for sulfatase activity
MNLKTLPLLCAVIIFSTTALTTPAGPSDKTHTIPSINYKMVYIAPGTFMMGSPPSEPRPPWKEKQHRVTLTKGFYIGVTEVTQKQWRTIMGGNPSHFKGDNLPVENVSWNDCQEFILKLNSSEGHNKYRLPTEAQWEYAARAGSKTAFANGGISGSGGKHDSNLNAMGWYNGNSKNKTHPVAQKKPNAWGLYDMHGNVWELCQDKYVDYSSEHVTDPIGSSYETNCVIRGGSFYHPPRDCRSAVRQYNSRESKASNIGLRLVGTQ